MQYTDIFFVNNNSSHIYSICAFQTNEKLNSLKVKQKYEQTVYVYKNLHLIIDNKSNDKICQRVESNEHLINNNMMFILSKITTMPLISFPMINKYHDTINRIVTVYENNICLIQENGISFIRIENDINNANKIIKSFL